MPAQHHIVGYIRSLKLIKIFILINMINTVILFCFFIFDSEDFLSFIANLLDEDILYTLKDPNE